MKYVLYYTFMAPISLRYYYLSHAVHGDTFFHDDNPWKSGLLQEKCTVPSDYHTETYLHSIRQNYSHIACRCPSFPSCLYPTVVDNRYHVQHQTQSRQSHQKRWMQPEEEKINYIVIVSHIAIWFAYSNLIAIFDIFMQLLPNIRPL